MPRDWQRIVFDNSPIYVKADAKGNRPSTLKTLKNFLRPSPTSKRHEGIALRIVRKSNDDNQWHGAICHE